MRRLLVLSCLLAALPVLMPAGEFDWMVREFSRESGVRQTHIPFLGLAEFVVAVGHPAGASSLKLAVFENANVEPQEFSRVADSVIGRAWRPIVRVRSRNGEASNIYMQPEGKYIRLLIASMDHRDATFVELRLRPEKLIKFIDEHSHSRLRN